MSEAWLQDWQPLPVARKLAAHGTLVEAAAALGVSLFASSPLGEGKLAQPMDKFLGLVSVRG
jgi:hypothetical protein